MIIRNIKKEDIRRCVEIYNYYIINSTATFEEQPLTEAQFAERVKRISADYPYLVAEEDGKVVGYAYLDKYNERSAYRFTAASDPDSAAVGEAGPGRAPGCRRNTPAVPAQGKAL